MKKIVCIVLCLVFVSALFVMPSSADAYPDGTVANGTTYGSVLGVGKGVLSPFDCLDLSYWNMTPSVGAYPIMNSCKITGATDKSNYTYIYNWFPNNPAGNPSLVDYVYSPTLFFMSGLNYMTNLSIDGNSYLRNISPSFSLAKLGDRIEFFLPIFIEHSGITNDRLTGKSLYFRFRPYDGKKFYVNDQYGEILAWTNIVYNGVVTNGPDWGSYFLRDTDYSGNDFPKCSYDYYTIQVVFDYNYDRFPDSYMNALPAYALYSCEIDFAWKVPNTQDQFFTSIVLGKMAYQRFENGYAVDFDGNLMSPSLNSVLDKMKEQTNNALSNLNFSKSWATSFVNWLSNPIKFFNGFVFEFFDYGHFTTFANLAYTLIFISIGSMLFGFAVDVIPSFVGRYKSKSQTAKSSARSAYGRYRSRRDMKKDFDHYYDHTEGRHYLPERRKR